jgi:hypothetical protein
MGLFRHVKYLTRQNNTKNTRFLSYYVFIAILFVPIFVSACAKWTSVWKKSVLCYKERIWEVREPQFGVHLYCVF